MKKVKYYKGDLVEYDVPKMVDFYDPILRTPTKLWQFDNKDKTVQLAFSLIDVLEEKRGIGLSANQVGLPWRVCVLNMGSEIWALFNPEIIDRSMTPSTYQEGCLSYPGLYLKLNRAEWVKVKFQDMNGGWLEQTFSGLTAVCVQHELDHLDGIVYTDKVSRLKLEQAKKKVKSNLKKIKKMSQEYVEVEESPQQEEAKITILPPQTQEQTGKNQPEKFVYNVG